MLDKIKALCDERGITIRQLEIQADIGNGTIGKWSDDHAPSLNTLVKISNFFGIPVTDLLERKE